MTILTLYSVMPSRTEEIGTLNLDHIDQADSQPFVDSIIDHLTLKPEANTFFRAEANDRSTKWDLAISLTEDFLSTATESQIKIHYRGIAHAFLKLGHYIKSGKL